MPNDPSLYGVIGLAIVWAGTIVKMLLNMRRQETAIRTNGHQIEDHQRVITELAHKLVNVEMAHEKAIAAITQSRDEALLRALKCEEELRSQSGAG